MFFFSKVSSLITSPCLAVISLPSILQFVSNPSRNPRSWNHNTVLVDHPPFHPFQPSSRNVIFSPGPFPTHAVRCLVRRPTRIYARLHLTALIFCVFSRSVPIRLGSHSSPLPCVKHVFSYAPLNTPSDFWRAFGKLTLTRDFVTLLIHIRFLGGHPQVFH